jgi:hypothetical protein
MKESTSRIIAGLEGTIICIPLTALFLYGGLPSAFYFAWNSVNIKYILDALVCLVITATLVCAWRLLLIFIIGGRTKLKSTKIKWWLLPYISACLSPIGLLLPGTAIAFFGWGVPLVLPLVHLHFERIRTNR